MSRPTITAVAIAIALSAVACHKKPAESTYGSTDTIRTGTSTPGPDGSVVSNSSGGATAIPINDTATTSTTGTTMTGATATGNASGSGSTGTSGTIPTDSTATTRTK